MKVLFIGGTGRLSKDVALYAADCGNDVYLITRGTAERKLFVDSRYHMLYGNARDGSTVRKLTNGLHFDVVIDFLSYTPDQLISLLDAVSDRCDQFIFISSAAVYKRVKGQLISEDKTEIGNDRWTYAYNKYLCEMELAKYYKDIDARYTIIRPAVTYGNTRIPYPIVPQDTQKEYSFLYRAMHGAPIPFFDDGKIDVTLTHTRDFAKAAIGLMGNPRAFGEAFHITSDEELQVGDVLNGLEEILGVEINRLNVTQEEIYTAIPYYKQILVGDKGEPAVYDNTKILKAVPGLSFDIKLIDGLRETVEFYREHPQMQVIDYLWMGNMDKLAIRKKAEIVRMERMSGNAKIEYLCGRYDCLEKAGKAIRCLRRKLIK